MGSFLYRLFFTRDDDLDLLQIAFLALLYATISTARAVALAPGASESVQVEALVTLRWLVGLLVLTAVPKWLVPVMAGVLKSRFGESAGKAASAAIAKRRELGAEDGTEPTD